MGFNHHQPLKLINHLRSVRGGNLDHIDVTELTKSLLKEWDGIETPASFSARGDKFEKQLEKAVQTKNPGLRLAFAFALSKRSLNDFRDIQMTGRPDDDVYLFILMSQDQTKQFIFELNSNILICKYPYRISSRVIKLSFPT
jgi:hypothetical protein